MVRLAKASQVEAGEITGEEPTVVCDLDGERAVLAARSLDCRTAVFVGDLDQPMDKAAADEFARELKAGERD